MPFKYFPVTSIGYSAFLALSLLFLAGCSLNKSDSGQTYAMGQEAVVGPLTYNVVETEWKESIDGSVGPRMPKHRFLLVNISVSNKSEKDIGIPLLTLIDEKGVEYREEDKGEGVASWLGFLRQVGPAEPLQGRLLFDVPPAGYKLRISSGGDAESETTALVDIPFRAEAPPVKAADPASVPTAK